MSVIKARCQPGDALTLEAMATTAVGLIQLGAHLNCFSVLGPGLLGPTSLFGEPHIDDDRYDDGDQD